MIANAGHVQILLSTYNGGMHLDDFLRSLLRQDYDNWSLLIRDDGSRDNTVEIIHDWKARFPDRISLFRGSGDGNLGVLRSFSTLLEASSAEYVMMADQDDIWLPEKVRFALEAMRARERQVPPGRPILVHTDLIVVDQDLLMLSPSYWAYQGLTPGRGRPFPRIMVENVVWGCTAMFNRPLIDIVGTIPDEAGHHDWWIALAAAAFGDIVSLKDARILWRRHGLNASQVSSVRNISLSAMANVGAARKRLGTLFEESRLRMGFFVDRYRDQLDAADLAVATAFLRLPQRALLAKRLDIIRYGLLFGSKRRNLGMLTLI
jgi:glycosyltransferase involved in cell wall biosynthesis